MTAADLALALDVRGRLTAMRDAERRLTRSPWHIPGDAIADVVEHHLGELAAYVERYSATAGAA